MRRLAPFRRPIAAIIILPGVFVVCGSARGTRNKPQPGGQGIEAPAKQVAYRKAFVLDDRLSALRREPSVHAEVIHRLRLGRPVFIIAGRGEESGRYCRVAVTRRTRGWIYESALAVLGRAGEDVRILRRVETSADTLDRIALCRLLIERFGRSRLVPRALLLIGQEAERVAQTLSQRARRRLGDHGVDDAKITLRDYYLNDTGLDRYSKLGVTFEFNESSAEYVYDGKAYREIVRRFPQCEEAATARARIELTRRKLANRE